MSTALIPNAYVPQTYEIVCEAIQACVPDMQRCCRDSWTLIGSAAAKLSGAEVMVSDLDILTSRPDAEALIELWSDRRDVSHVPADGDRFRSRFARFRFPGLPLEIMGGLECLVGQRWLPVTVSEIFTVDVAGFVIPLPVVSEQIRILETFGRPKDLQRAELLRSLKCG